MGATTEGAKTWVSGALVCHPQRPGVWRLLGVLGELAQIEPWDDLAGGSLHAAECYCVTVPVEALNRLSPGACHAC